MWDLHAATPRAAPLGPRPHGLYAAAQFLGPSILAVTFCTQWRRYDLADGSEVPLTSEQFTAPVNAIADPGGRVLKMVSRATYVRAESSIGCDVVTFPLTPAGLGAPVRRTFIGGQPSVCGFTPGGERYLVGTSSEWLHLCDAATDAAVATFEPPRDGPLPSGWVFAPDGRRVFANCPDRVAAYDAAGGPPAREVKLPAGCRPESLAVHPGGRFLAVAEGLKTVAFRDAESLEVLRRYDFKVPQPRAVAFSPDGTRCAIGAARGKVLLFDVDE